MRKLLTILFSFLAFVCVAQNTSTPTPPLPNWNYVGSPTYLTDTRGVHRVAYGFIHARYADTATANANAYIKSYPGLVIVVGDTVYMRNSTATGWLVTNGSGGSGSVVVSNGLSLSVDTISLGGLWDTPSKLLTSRSIDLNLQKFFFQKGDTILDASLTDFNGDRNTPLGAVIIDSVGNTNNPDFDVLPKMGGSWTRIIRWDGNGRRMHNRYGWRFKYQYELSDSVRDQGDGGDYQSALIGDKVLIPFAGSNTKRLYVSGHGTNSWIHPNEGIPALIGNVQILGNDSAYIYGKGFIKGVGSYLVMGASRDTLENFVYYGASSYITANNWLKKSYFLRPDVYWNRTDSIFFAFDTVSLSRTYQAGKWMIGKSQLGTWALPHTLVVNGGVLLTDTANYHTNIAARFSARSLVDKNYVDSSISVIPDPNLVIQTAGGGEPIWYTSGDTLYLKSINGATTGTDSSLTISGGGSSLFPPTGTGTATGAVIGDLDGNTFSITDGGNDFFSIDPTAGSETIVIGAFNSTGSGNRALIQPATQNTSSEIFIEANFNDDEEIAEISLSAQSGSSTLSYSADTHTFTGAIIASSLANDAGQDRLVGQTASDGQIGYVTIGSGLDLTAGVLTATGGGGSTDWSTVNAGAVTSADHGLVDGTSDQPVFPTCCDDYTLAANTTYEFEAFYHITAGNNTATIATGFTPSGGASVTSIKYHALSWVSNGVNSTTTANNTSESEQTGITVVTVTTTNVNRFIRLKGIIRMNAGGVITPIIRFSAAPGTTGSDNNVKPNSWIKFIKIGDGSVTAFGNVN